MIKLIEKSVDELIPYENNPRRNEEAIKYVLQSIKDFGYKIPIIIDKNNVVITGHTRLEALKKLKVKVIPCIVADDLTEEQAKAFRIADNKVGEVAVWNLETLKEEIKNITIDLEQYGQIKLNDINFDDLLKDSIKQKKTIICPHCGNKIAL